MAKENTAQRIHAFGRRSLWLALTLALAAFFAGCAVSTPYDGTYIDRFYSGSKLIIKGSQAMLAETKNSQTYTVKGKISKASSGEFQVDWQVSDPNAIKKSRFVPEIRDSKLAAIHEYPLDGLVSDLEIVYYPVSAYAQGTFVSASGGTMTATFNSVLKTVAVVLPDNEHFILPQALSASGTRYSDGTNTYWEHQGSAIFEIASKQIFEGRQSSQ